MALVVVQSTRPEYLETVSCKNLRGTRGTLTAISGSEDELILRQLAKPVLQLFERNVMVIG